MNIEIFKRNIKLQELGIGKLSDKEQEILDFLNNNLSNLNSHTSDEYGDYLFLGKDKDNIVLNYIEKNGYLNVSYDKIWSFLESKFNMEYINVRELMKWWVEDTLHLKVNHIDFFHINYPSTVEDTLHLKVNHTIICGVSPLFTKK